MWGEAAFKDHFMTNYSLPSMRAPWLTSFDEIQNPALYGLFKVLSTWLIFHADIIKYSKCIIKKSE